jgi:hypothetical protein
MRWCIQKGHGVLNAKGRAGQACIDKRLMPWNPRLPTPHSPRLLLVCARVRPAISTPSNWPALMTCDGFPRSDGYLQHSRHTTPTHPRHDDQVHGILLSQAAEPHARVRKRRRPTLGCESGVRSCPCIATPASSSTHPASPHSIAAPYMLYAVYCYGDSAEDPNCSWGSIGGKLCRTPRPMIVFSPLHYVPLYE